MNGKEINHWRESVKSDLSSVKTDVRWIKNNLSRMDARQDHLASQVAWLKGVGSLVGLLLGSLLSLVASVVF